MNKIKALLKLMRIYSYTKNGFVAAPLIFANQLTNLLAVKNVLIGVFFFCLLSSAVYIFNDIRDIEIDRKHPQNCKRPLAAKEISLWFAGIFSLLLFAISLGGSYLLNPVFFTYAFIYALLHISYSLGVKHISIVESFIVALGFVLRVMAGSILVKAPASEWIILATFFLALLLVFGKRKCEQMKFEQSHTESPRLVLAHYPSYWLDQCMSIAAAVSVLTYSLYCISPRGFSLGGKSMVFTVIPVLLGLYRFLQLDAQGKLNEELGQVVFKDAILLSAILIWIIVLIALIYIK